MTRRKMASSQGLLWILGTHKLGLGDRSINCGHQFVLWGKVCGLRVPRVKGLKGHFSKQSKGWSRSKL